MVGSLTINDSQGGGCITGGYGYDGGGVYAGGGTTFSGLCTITGNTVGGQNNNVFRVSELYIGGTLDPATRIGINVNREYVQQRVITYGLNGKGSLDNFFCDVEGDQLSLNDDGEAVMTLPPVNGTRSTAGSSTASPPREASTSTMEERRY